MSLERAPEVLAPDDLSLARRAAEGDRAAQRLLFRGHKARVHRTLYRILGSNRDLEDLLQEAFLEVFRSLPNFRGESQLATWITRITTRVALGYISRRKPPSASLELVPEVRSDEPSALQTAMAREAASHLYRALDRIDPKQRIAFVLFAVEGMPLKEIAEVTESSLVATKTRVWRARRELEARAKKDPLLAAFLGREEVIS